MNGCDMYTSHVTLNSQQYSAYTCACSNVDACKLGACQRHCFKMAIKISSRLFHHCSSSSMSAEVKICPQLCNKQLVLTTTAGLSRTRRKARRLLLFEFMIWKRRLWKISSFEHVVSQTAAHPSAETNIQST